MKKKYFILIPIIILLILSFIYLPNNLKYKQLIWIFIGLFLCILLSKVKFTKIIKFSFIYYLFSIFLLLIVLLINKYTNGSRGWISLGKIAFQPSELVKISIILFTTKYFNKLNIWTLLLTYIIPMILIFIEPDTGGVIILFIILIFFLIKKLNNRQILKLSFLFVCIILLIVIIYLYNKDLLINLIGPSIFYRFDRITSFLNDDNLQTSNALISIATSNTLYFPEMYNDFFISYILSKNIYLIIIILTCTTSILIYLNKKNTIISKVVFYIILFQCYLNILMNLKLVPVIGLPYLFLSYGGSHIITSLILIGIIINSDNSMDCYNNMDYYNSMEHQD